MSKRLRRKPTKTVGDPPHQQRRCIACNRTAPNSELWRLVVVERRLVWDRERCLPGRGAYVHPRLECVLRLGDAGRIGRAFRAGEVQLSSQSVPGVIEECIKFVN